MAYVSEIFNGCFFGLLKKTGGHLQLCEFMPSLQVGGKRRGGEDIRNSLDKQVIRISSPN